MNIHDYEMQPFPQESRSQSSIEAEVKSIIESIKKKSQTHFPGKPDSPPQELGLRTWYEMSRLNPNNGGVHTKDNSSIENLVLQSPWYESRKLERHIIAAVASLYSPCFDRVDGYVTSGSTEGNITALWIARNWFARVAPDSTDGAVGVLLSRAAHFSLHKACDVLNIGREHWKPCSVCGNRHLSSSARENELLRFVAVDEDYSLSLEALDIEVKRFLRLGIRKVIVVATLGTTISGSIDSVAKICRLLKVYREKNGLVPFVHVDAAFGGLIIPFHDRSAELLSTDDWTEVRSLTLDWHKFGLAPYGAGTLICTEGLFDAVTRDARYTTVGYDSTLLGSRSGAMVAACWTLLQHLGWAGFRKLVNESIRKTESLRELLQGIAHIEVLSTTPLNLIPIRVVGRSDSACQHAREVLRRHGIRPEGLSVSEVECPKETFPLYVMPHLAESDLTKFVAALS